jgi:hypothetical protein
MRTSDIPVHLFDSIGRIIFGYNSQIKKIFIKGNTP